ncbi:MAG TPA: phospholipase D family protein [Solirubrobacteraceae bacterium]|nr:phospholipase D family protein [Solirubrobacteraceae bacterium]
MLLRPPGASVGGLLAAELRSTRWTTFRAGVAFAKMSGVKHLDAPLRAFVSRGGRCTISVGMDQGGSSFEALSQLLGAVHGGGDLYIVHEKPGGSPTFHPKVYLFADGESSPRRALAIVGSANLTQGGLFTNYEASLAWRPDLADAASRGVLSTILGELDRWASTANGLCIHADIEALLGLHHDGRLPTERQIARRQAQRTHGQSRGRRFSQRDALEDLHPQPRPVVPPAPELGLPAVVLAQPPDREQGGKRSAPGPRGGGAAPGGRRRSPRPKHRALVIDITQSQKTECYLAKTPVDEDPGFFGWPGLFTGLTKPKRPTGVAQPQRHPWPAVDLLLRDPNGAVSHCRVGFHLKMDRFVNPRPGGRRGNQDMRLGVPAEVLHALPTGCLLRMERRPRPGVVYLLEFLSPGSTQWSQARAVANRRLPGSQRKFGWV